jgi:hypothetical protein
MVTMSITLHPMLAEHAAELGLGPVLSRYRCRPNYVFAASVAVLILITVLGAVRGMNGVVWTILMILTAILTLSWLFDHLARRAGGLYFFADGIVSVRGPAHVEHYLLWQEIEDARWVKKTFWLVVNLVPIPFWKRDYLLIGHRDGEPVELVVGRVYVDWRDAARLIDERLG